MTSASSATASAAEKALDKLADVHRGWCNYCKGDAVACLNAPSGGCSLRDYMIALDSPRSESAPTPPADATEEMTGHLQKLVDPSNACSLRGTCLGAVGALIDERSARSARREMTEEKAREILGDTVQDDDHLYNLGHYIAWDPEGGEVTLDCSFGSEELEAIVWWMNNKVKP